ncbi:MAG: hypothetical protein PHH77_12170 [Victivallaceae bacterium]|nr:hypothetical protein [Victivallaceae bacterium]
MNNLAVNAAEGVFYPVGSSVSQSIYEYFTGNKRSRLQPKTNRVCFIAENGDLECPCQTFNRSFEEIPKYPYFRMMSHSDSLLTVWYSQQDKEPAEFEVLNLADMSRENVAWLRAAGEVTSLVLNRTGKLLGLVYHDDNWRVDVRRANNFQLREVVHHAAPITGVFFHKDIVFSLSNKLVVSYPEDRRENSLIHTGGKVLGWAHHPTDPYLIAIEPEHYWIVDLNELKVIKTAEWPEQIKWFNLLRKYSNYSFDRQADSSTVAFSNEGNRLFLGGYGELAVFDWHDMLRPRSEKPEPLNVLDLDSNVTPNAAPGAHIINMMPINRDRLLCVTADGYLRLLNIRTEEKYLLLTPGSGVRINSLQVCARGKRLAMVGYYYGIDRDGRCRMESALLIWKLSRLLNRGIKI